jgi:hypothetical protein
MRAETYGTIYGMKRTTVFLPEELKAKLERAAAARGRSEADLIREGVRLVLAEREPPKPTIPLFSSGMPGIAERIDEALEGFGEE